MRALAVAALGMAAYGVFLVAGMPASFLLERARAAQTGKFEVRESSGSAWHGRAAVAFNAPGGSIVVDRLEWRWIPARLFAGRLAFDIAASGSGLEARYEGARTVTRWEVRDLDVRGEAAAMTRVLPWIAPWRPEGKVSIASSQLASDGRELLGDARVEWRGAAVAHSDVRPLGSYRADIHAEGSAGKVAITTLEGPLRVTGQGTLTPPARFAFSGEARAEGAEARALEPLLDLIGPPGPDGARTLNWQAR